MKLWVIYNDETSEAVFLGTAEECMGWLWSSSDPFDHYSVEPAQYALASDIAKFKEE